MQQIGPAVAPGRIGVAAQDGIVEAVDEIPDLVQRLVILVSGGPVGVGGHVEDVFKAVDDGLVGGRVAPAGDDVDLAVAVDVAGDGGSS